MEKKFTPQDYIDGKPIFWLAMAGFALVGSDSATQAAHKADALLKEFERRFIGTAYVPNAAEDPVPVKRPTRR